MTEVRVIGAGLAGSEAAWQLAERGFAVRLSEMKPVKMTPAHHCTDFAELVCSNSLRSDELTNAVGLLKEEMRQLGSLILKAADATRVPAGGALAVDRYGFSKLVTEKIRSHPNITVVPGEVTAIPEGNVIIASGPLTSDALAAAIDAAIDGLKAKDDGDKPGPGDGGKPGAGDGKPGDGKPGKGDETKPDAGKKGGLSATGAGIVPIAAAALTLMAGAALALAKR